MNGRLKVVFRADASVDIGTGHIARCLSLADELRRRGASVDFACVAWPGNLIPSIRGAGYACHELPGLDAPVPSRGDWLVVDHYKLNANWEQGMRRQFSRIFVIDDLADRKHACDILLDQNYYTDMLLRYKHLVPDRCRLFLGPRYALLRPEFVAARQHIPARSGIVKRILIFFGGSDPTNETTKALQALGILRLDNIAVDVVVGSSNTHREAVQEMCRRIPDCTFYCQVTNMAELMARADLAIGAGGSASWERCYLGLPAIGIAVAANQERLLADLADYGAIIDLGRSSEITPTSLAGEVRRVLEDKRLREKISYRSWELMRDYAAGAVSAVLTEEANV